LSSVEHLAAFLAAAASGDTGVLQFQYPSPEERPLDQTPPADGDDAAVHSVSVGKVDEQEAGLLEALEETSALDVRQRVVRAAMVAREHAPEVHYTQTAARWDGIRRGLRSHRGEYPRYADCSSLATWCLWDALGGPYAGPDLVNGADWKAGYTGTMMGHGRRVALADAQPGDLVFYGPPPGKHVVIAVAPGRAVSHGSEGGPYLLSPTYRPDLSEVRRYLPAVQVPQWPGRYLRRPPDVVGPDVALWQQRMRQRGWTLNVTGVYDAATVRVCRQFQTEKALEVDGVVGPETWRGAWIAPVT
jgi:cell wall-associated NlpC family hydrolase